MKNQNEIDAYLDKLIDKAEEQIDRIYAKRLKEILNIIRGMFEKHEKDGVLTMAEMSKYNRLSKSVDSILRHLLTAQKDAYKLTQTTMEEQFLINYFRSAYLYEFEAQAKLGFGAISKEVIQAAIKNPIDKLTLPALLERNRKIIVDRISTEIQQGLIAGESYGKMSRRIRDAVDFDRHKSRTVARTEAHRAQIEGRMRSAEQAAKHVHMEKMWDGTLDSKTRLSHRKLDGTVKSMAGIFKGLTGVGPAPGFMSSASENINCRCTLNYLVEGRKPEIRRARFEDGKTKVISWTNYEDWHKNRIAS